jgi:hypothetical protein
VGNPMHLKVAVAGLDPAIHAFRGPGGLGFQDVDARIKFGQSELKLQERYDPLPRVAATAKTGQPWIGSGHDELVGIVHHLNASKHK